MTAEEMEVAVTTSMASSNTVEKVNDGIEPLHILDQMCTTVLCSYLQSKDIYVGFLYVTTDDEERRAKIYSSFL